LIHLDSGVRGEQTTIRYRELRSALSIRSLRLAEA
jgi:hypothetical protein